MGCNDQTLTLALGFPSSPKSSNLTIKATPNHAKQPAFDQAEPSLTLSLELSGETFPTLPELSAASSHSNSLAAPPNFVSVKREREAYTASDEEEDGSPTATAATNNTATRKKLRLTKEQSALLEESFKQHSTLNPKQKQALADRLHLRPRQVEVWFQNRRARTKLKQTEVDCEQLKKCCETLTDENRRLQKELQDLKALKLGHPNSNLYMHLPPPAATLAICPSCCQRIGSGTGAGVSVPVPIAAATPASGNSLAFTLGPGSGSKTHFYPSFPNPSAAC